MVGGYQVNNVTTDAGQEEEGNKKEENSLDKHEIAFFKDYNDAYGYESNNNTGSIVHPNKSNYNTNKRKNNYKVKNKNKYKKEYIENKEDNNNSINENKISDEIIPWTLDSGATFHMTGNINCLTNVRKFNRIIYFPNGGYVRSKNIGDYIGYVNNNKIVLKDVLYIPVFKKSLLSVDCLSDRYYKTVFHRTKNKNRVAIYNKYKKRICSTSPISSKVYIVHTSKNKIKFKNITKDKHLLRQF
eukprot:jgi/Orpsp1_1/1184579/evm.model.c7180000090085.1